MADEYHSWNWENDDPKHGPGCLNRHVSWYAASNPCSHRGQAYQKAESEGGPGPKNRYSWPALVPGGPRKPGAWDFGGKDNFKRSSRKPWWHEAHHIVPHAELRDAMDKVGAGFSNQVEIVAKVRRGLRKEGYNLNEKINMIILPVKKKQSDVLGLPLHRKTEKHMSHDQYSDMVEVKLRPIFSSMKASADRCKKPPPYLAVRKKIEHLSTKVYQQILKSEAPNLDFMVSKKSLGPSAL
jgi:hypothetical protein